MNRKQLVLNMLGLAKRANKLVFGSLVLEEVRQGHVSLLFLATDASEGTKKKYRDKCLFYGVDVDETMSIEELSQAVGMTNRVVVGVVDQGFAKRMKSY